MNHRQFRAYPSTFGNVRLTPPTRGASAVERGAAGLIRLVTAELFPPIRPKQSYFLPDFAESSVDRAATNASWGTSTRPMVFIRFLPSFCFSSSLRLRVMSPP